MISKQAIFVALAAYLSFQPTFTCAAEDIPTQSAKWMKISGYIIGTAVALGVSEDDAMPVGNKVIDNTFAATENNVNNRTLAEIHVKTFLGSIKMQKKIGLKGCDVAIAKYEKLKSSQ